MPDQPHSYDAPLIARDKRKCTKDVPPDYVLPRFFTTAHSHPFHPDLALYIAGTPFARVHWIIPVQGPVIIPGWADSITGSHPVEAGPSPSAGDLLDHLLPSDLTQRSAILAWTPDLLRHLMTAFLLPLCEIRDQPFGPISIRLSGPKPDPFIALKPYPPLVSHQYLPPLPINKDATGPVRGETGDHIRVYCDAKGALGLRTWFHGIEVDRAMIKAGEGLLRPFDKVRLILVGEMGEALIVA